MCQERGQGALRLRPTARIKKLDEAPTVVAVEALSQWPVTAICPNETVRTMGYFSINVKSHDIERLLWKLIVLMVVFGLFFRTSRQ